MKKILATLLILLFSSIAFAAVPSIAIENKLNNYETNSNNLEIKFQVRDTDKDVEEINVSLLKIDGSSSSFFTYIATNLDENSNECNISSSDNSAIECDFNWSIPRIEGTFLLEVQAIDAQGNAVSKSLNSNYLIDRVPALIEIVSPRENQENISLTSLIKFNLTDEGSGINKNEIKLTVLNDTYDLSDSELSFNSSSGRLTFDRTGSFEDNYTVNVSLRVKDNLGNLETKSYSFRTRENGSTSSNNSNSNNSSNTEVQGNSISIIRSKDELNLNRGNSAGIDFTFKNISGNSFCSNLFTEVSDSDLEASLPVNEICLNSGESVTLTLFVYAAEFASSDSYEVSVIADNEEEVTSTIEVNVNSNDLFAVSRLDSEINSDSLRDSIRARITNRSNSRETINLNAFSDYFLPYFEPSRITLDEDESRTVDLFFNINNSVPLGSHEIGIELSGDTFTQTESFSVQLMNSFQSKELSILGSSLCQSASKGTAKNISFTVSNSSDADQSIDLWTENGKALLSLNSFNLRRNSSQRVSLNFTPSLNEASGNQYAKVFAFNGIESTEFEFCFNVAKSRAVNFSFPESIAMKTGEEKTINLIVENSGDFTNSTEIEFIESIEGIKFSFNKEKISLNSGESKSIPVIISADENALAGDFTFKVKAKVGSLVKEEVKTIKVVAIDKLNFNSYPAEINLISGEEKEIELILSNLGNSNASNIKIELIGLPQGISFNSIQLNDLFVNESKPVKLNLKASNEIESFEGNALLRVSNENFLTEKLIYFNVQGNEKQENKSEQKNNVIGAGFASLGSSYELGLILLFVLIVGIGFFIVRDKHLAKKQKKGLEGLR